MNWKGIAFGLFRAVCKQGDRYDDMGDPMFRHAQEAFIQEGIISRQQCVERKCRTCRYKKQSQSRGLICNNLHSPDFCLPIAPGMSCDFYELP